MAVNQNVTQLTQQTTSADPTSLFYAVTNGTTDTGLSLAVLFNNPTFTGTVVVPGYLTSALAAATYLTQANAASTYLTQANAASTYLTQTSAASTYLTQANATSTYLTITTAASTYATITNLALKAPIASPTFTGTVTIPGGASISGYATLASPTFTGTVVIPTVTLSGGTINSTSVGATTPSTGAFTTISATSTITPSQTSGIVGTTTNNNANAGSFGEYLTNATTGTALTTNVTATATSVSLTAGDWDVSGVATYVPAGTTTTVAVTTGISLSGTAFGAANTGSFIQLNMLNPGAGIGEVQGSPTLRLSLSATTTVFLVFNAAFSVSTATVNGFIRARRMR